MYGNENHDIFNLYFATIHPYLKPKKSTKGINMFIRSAKIQFLFWTAFFSVLLYLWIVTLGLQTFVLPDEKPMELPADVILLLFILYGLLAVSLVTGTIISTMINNKFYTKFFGIFVMLALATLLAAKSMFG